MSDWNQLIHTLNWGLYAKIGSGIGTAITVLKGVSAAVSQYTREEKQKREINRATRLMNFMSRVTQAPERISSQEMSDLLPVLDRELKVTLTGIRVMYEPPRPDEGLSTLQRAFLLYTPVGVWSWVAHILFYSTAAITVMATFGFFIENDALSWKAGVRNFEGGGAIGLLLFGFIAWICRRWALNRWRARLNGADRTTIPTKKTPYLRLSISAWIISALYGLSVILGVLGAIQDRDPDDTDPMSFKTGLLIFFFVMPPLFATVGLAIAARRARILERTEKHKWCFERLFLVCRPLTTGTLMATAVRYLIIFALFVFVFNLGHSIRRQSPTLSDYWTANLHEPWIFILPLLLVLLPLSAALKWGDLESALALKKNELQPEQMLNSA